MIFFLEALIPIFPLQKSSTTDSDFLSSVKPFPTPYLEFTAPYFLTSTLLFLYSFFKSHLSVHTCSHHYHHIMSNPMSGTLFYDMKHSVAPVQCSLNRTMTARQRLLRICVYFNIMCSMMTSTLYLHC